METRQFNVTGMSCAACSSRVEKAVCALRGVSAAEVNLLTNSLKATFDEGVLGVEDIERAVEDAGYGASEKGFAGRGRTAAATAALRRTRRRRRSRARAPHLVLCAARTPSCGFRWGRWRACPCRHAHGGAGRSDDGLPRSSCSRCPSCFSTAATSRRPQALVNRAPNMGQPHRGWIGHSAALWRLRDLQASCGPGCG